MSPAFVLDHTASCSNVAIIPAKGFSRRIEKKNIRDFLGQPIISYSIESAKASGLFGRVVVSTDSDEVAEVAERYGATIVRRGPELAREEVGTQEIAAHALEGIPADIACVIYATNPLMSIGDLRRGLRELEQRQAHYAFSVGTEPLRDAAQFYWGRAFAFKSREPLIWPGTVMIPIDDSRVCDINTMQDWFEAERKYEALHKDAA